MFARNVAFSLKPNSVPEFTQKFETEVLPLLQKQTGFSDEFSVVDVVAVLIVSVSAADVLAAKLPAPA